MKIAIRFSKDQYGNNSTDIGVYSKHEHQISLALNLVSEYLTDESNRIIMEKVNTHDEFYTPCNFDTGGDFDYIMYNYFIHLIDDTFKNKVVEKLKNFFDEVLVIDVNSKERGDDQNSRKQIERFLEENA